LKEILRANLKKSVYGPQINYLNQNNNMIAFNEEWKLWRRAIQRELLDMFSTFEDVVLEMKRKLTTHFY